MSATTKWTPVDRARIAFSDLCKSIGSDAVAEESAILSIGREFLPPCAIAVLDDCANATVEYYEWLTETTLDAQAGYDVEYAAGHEWHEWQP